MIDILMSTYNGERFLAEQLDSILGQSHGDFALHIRDDGSVDGTVDLLQRYASSDARMRLVEDERGNLGARESFMSLIENVEKDYFMLADQDDVWLPKKIERSLDALKAIEKEHGSEKPALVFSDLKVVDSDRRVIADSLWQYQKLNPRIAENWKDLLAQNVVTGCTIIANRAAANASLPFAIPEMMHDQWIAVSVARMGHISFLAGPSVLYRQHGGNVEGGRKFGVSYAARSSRDAGSRYALYQRAAAHFGDISAAEIAARKLRLNLKRFFQ